MPDEVQVPTHDRLMWPAITALKQMGGSGSHAELLDHVVEHMGLPEEVQAVPMKGGRGSRVAYNLRWAVSWLGKDGVLENTARGVWALTPKGRELKEEDIKGLVARVRKMGPTKRPTEDAAIAPTASDKAEGSPPPSTWREDLIGVLLNMKADAFERLCQLVLREAGFLKVEVKGRTGDGGIDGVGVLRLKLLSFQICFQCKKWSGAIPPNEIRDFRGAMHGRTDKGLFITTGRYTQDAQREANRPGALAVDLIDGDQLCELLKELRLGVTTTQVEHVAIERGWFDQI